MENINKTSVSIRGVNNTKWKYNMNFFASMTDMKENFKSEDSKEVESISLKI